MITIGANYSEALDSEALDSEEKDSRRIHLIAGAKYLHKWHKTLP